jgi:hypothetical protein
MISTSFTIQAGNIYLNEKRNLVRSMLIWAIICGAAGGLIPPPTVAPAIAVISALLIGPLIGCMIEVWRYYRLPAQFIKTTLESDGVKIWAFNERQPDVERKGRCQLFAGHLNQIAACESGNAFELFGSDYALGAFKILPTFVGIVPARLGSKIDAAQSEGRRSVVAIFLRGSPSLSLLFAANITKALAFDLVGQVNSFLDDARALRAAPPVSAPPTSGVSTSASGGFGFDL